MDIPEGMTVEEAVCQHGPMTKVLWESPSGEDIEVRRGMNVASMLEAGLIAPFDQESDDGEGLPARGGGAGSASVQPSRGVFDPAAVKGAQERTTEVSELYAKVIANKAKAKANAAGSSAATQNGYNGSDVTAEINGSNAWLSGVLGKGRGSGSKEKPATQKPATAYGKTGDAAGMRVAADSAEGNAEGGEEMVGYDFILKDRDDKEGKVAQGARASIR